MVSRFDMKFNNFARSVQGMKRNSNINPSDSNAMKALLYDFNGCVEQGWKLIKYYLELVNGLEDLGNQSKKVIRAGKDDGLYDENLAFELMDMIDLRNVLSHEYNYDQIENSCRRISNYMSTIETLYEIIYDLRIKHKHYWDKDMVDI